MENPSFEDKNEDELSPEQKKNKVFVNLKHDYDSAEKGKKIIDQKISDSRTLYEAETKKRTVKGKSLVVSKEIAKQIEWLKPNITEPFLSTSSPVRVTNFGVKNVNAVEKYLNASFTTTFDRVNYINKLTNITLVEGTGWTRVGWEYQNKVKEVVEELTMEELLQNPDIPHKLVEISENKFRATYLDKTLLKNKGTARVCRNEYVLPDPKADSLESMRFLCEIQYKTISELRASKLYKEEDIKKIERKIEDKDDGEDSALASSRKEKNLEYGQEDFVTKDINRNKVKIVEYWGIYDLNEDGIAEPIVATWAKDEDILLRLESSSNPSGEIPYYNNVYSEVPFSLWGNSVSYFIEDNQNIKSGLLRGILDNMKMANNGQKFIQTGTMDYLNARRMKEGQQYIEVLRPDGVQDGSYNAIPASVFNVIQMVTEDSNELTGNNSGGQALSNDMLAKDSAGGSLTMAQQRMAASVRSLSNVISKVLKEWLIMSELFLENDQIDELFSDEEETDFYAFKYSTKANINIKVSTQAQRQIKLQQMNMLMQQSKTLGQSVPPEIYNSIVAEMYESFDMYQEATKLREYVPEPSPEEQKMQQLSMQEQELKIQKLQVEIQADMSKIELDKALAMKAIGEAQSGNEYKKAQVLEKKAKARKTDVETALDPAKFLAEVKNMQQQKEKEKSI